MERMFVADQVYDRFVERFVSRTEAMSLGASLDWEVDMGPLISSDQLDTVVAHVDDAVAKGATVLAGGRPRPDLGPYFYEPTVLAGVTEDMALCRDETFGPVVSVTAVRDEGEAVDRANDSAYGLHATIWSRDVRHARSVAARIRTGTVSINETYAAAWGATGSPMGGVKDSGLGRRHGREGILKYTDAQTVAVQRLHGFAPPPSVSRDRWARGYIASLRTFKALGRR
jgi:succinate-semialdehyde dehydrogenase/glutarate-semialdehyde dehydrogenase